MSLKIKGCALKFRQDWALFVVLFFCLSLTSVFKCENSVVGLKITDLNSADLL